MLRKFLVGVIIGLNVVSFVGCGNKDIQNVQEEVQLSEEELTRNVLTQVEEEIYSIFGNKVGVTCMGKVVCIKITNIIPKTMLVREIENGNLKTMLYWKEKELQAIEYTMEKSEEHGVSFMITYVDENGEKILRVNDGLVLDSMG